jgi:hypothetical protein
MARSAIPTFRATLKTKLAARAALSGVQISLVRVGDPQPEWIWIARGYGDQAVAGLRAGLNPREETFRVLVYIRSIKSNIENETECSDRVFALMGEIEDELRSNLSVDSTVRSAEVEEYELDEWENGDQRGADLVLTLKCTKRLPAG